MKKLVLLLLLAFPLSLKAESASVGGNFRGLNNGDSSILIADNEAQDLLNVDLTKNAYGVSKRAGYAQFKTIGTSTWGVRGGYYFTDQSGNNKIVHANGTGVFYSLNGGAYTGFYTTATAGSYWDFVDSQGILYGANHNHDPPFTYNGTALTFSTSVPAGSQVEAYPDRLVVAGSTANPNNIYFSRAANFSDFTVGDLSDDAPYFEYYGLPGQLVQAIKYALGELLIWTKTSMGRYVGSNQFDGTIDDISSAIGSDQPSTVVTDMGVTYFQATDRHFYAYDGQSLAKISDAISGSVDGFSRGESKSSKITSQSDFEAGSISRDLTTATSPGDVLFSTGGILIDDFSDGDYTANPVWTPYASTTWEVSSEKLRPNGGLLSGPSIYTTTTSLNVGIWDLTVQAQGANCDFKFYLAVSSDNATTNGYEFRLDSANSGIRIYRLDGGVETLLASNLGSVTATAVTRAEVDITAAGLMTFKAFEGESMSNAVSATDTTYSSHTHLIYTSQFAAGSYRFALDRLGFRPSTGTFQSAPINIGTAITSWGPVYINNVLNGGSISYALYKDTDTNITISDASSWTSSQTVTNNQIPTFATAPYITWTANFSRTASTHTPTINDLTINWFEGTNARNWGVVDEDHRILWSVTEGTATAPNATYIYDPRYQSWLKYSVPFDAPAKVGNSIYFGGVSTGVVYQWPSGNTDNGSAINAYWKSKDFIAPDPYVEKDFLSASVVAKTQTGSNLDVTYTINTSSSITRNFSLTDSNGLSLKRINFNLPSGKYGTFFNLKFGNDDSDSPFEFYSFKYDYKPRPWRQIQ